MTGPGREGTAAPGTAVVPRISMEDLLGRYDVLYLDAYGVLIDHSGPLPGAPELVSHLHAAGKPYLILTNDASRSPETSSRRYEGMGLPIPADRIVTSGLLLAGHFAANGLIGARCAVLGTGDSRDYVSRAGGVLAPVGEDAAALVLCDEMGFPYREHLDAALTFLYRRLDRGERVHLVLANPDLVYPAAPGQFGFTAGAMAILLEAALDLRYPGAEHRFVRLGKPHAPMFEEARRRLDRGRAIMIGDQLGTDIRGARDFGLHSALVSSGIARVDELLSGAPVRPTYILESLEVSGA